MLYHTGQGTGTEKGKLMDITANSRPGLKTWTLSIRRRWRLTAGLVGLDALAIAAAFALAYLLRFYNPLWPYYSPFTLAFYLRLGLAMVPAWLALFAFHHLYDPEELLGGTREYVNVISAVTTGVVVMLAYDFLLRGEAEISRGWLLLTWPLAILVVGGTRFTLRRVVYAMRRRGRWLRPAVVVGANEEGRAVAHHLGEASAASGVRIVGFVDDDPPADQAGRPGPPLLGTLADLPRLIAQHDVRELIVAGTALPRERLLDLFRQFGQNGGNVTVRLSSGLYEILTTGMRVRKVGYVPLVTLERTRITGVDAVLKRLLDVGGSLLGLLLAGLPMLVIAMLVRVTSPGPVLYRRRVIGQGGRPFDALKFRTMRGDGAALLAGRPDLQEELRRAGKLKDDPRVTPLGRTLRRFSLDELPQLLNILAGQMSLVGPRMITVEEWPHYGKWQHNLLTVKPGLTGLWQVSGRSDVAYEERVRLDMHYIRNYTIWLDLQLVLQTVGAVLRGTGAY